MGLGANATDPDAVQVHGTNPQVGSKQVHAPRLAGHGFLRAHAVAMRGTFRRISGAMRGNACGAHCRTSGNCKRSYICLAAVPLACICRRRFVRA